MNNLLLFMTLSGTAAFGGYCFLRQIFKENLPPEYRYLLLKMVMLFYLLPFPLLGSGIKKRIGMLFHNEMLLNGYSWGKNYQHLDRGKFYYVIDGNARLPDYRFTFWLFLIIWATMAGICLVNFIYQREKLKKIKRIALREYNSVCLYVDQEYENIFRKYKVKLLVLPAGTEAFTYGFFFPVIVIPEGMQRQEIEFILKHELIHIKKKDVWVNVLSYLIIAVHFYNPAVYLLYKEIMKTAEFHCDEQILKNADRKERLQYGHLLVERAVRVSGQHFTMGFSRQKNKELKERIAMIKKPPVKKRYVCLISAAFIVFSGTVPVLGYVKPEAVESDAVIEEEIEYVEIGENREVSIVPPEDEKMFRITDSYCLTESNQIVLDSMYEKQQKIWCKHNYVSATQKVHAKFASGGCKVDVYSVKKCTKCATIKDKKLTNSVTYKKCIH